MDKQNYFLWLTENTESKWTNDSAILSQIENARKIGAIGCTTNPPLSYEALTVDTEIYGDDLSKISRDCTDDEFALQAMSLVVKNLSNYWMEFHKEKGGLCGKVRAQVAPNLRNDAEGMLKVGKILSSWGENVMVKIPATEAGVWTLEELAALGIPTNPTVTTSVSQMIAVAEAYERGVARAEKAGITPGVTTIAIVMGRIQDYLDSLRTERGIDIETTDLEWAALAVVKRTEEVAREKKYKSIIQPAAFRCARHVEQISGGPFCSTIHPKVQKMVEEADAAGLMKREVLFDAPVDQGALDRVCKAFPEFLDAYEYDALKPSQFVTYGATEMTLDGFDIQGWQKLITLR